MQYEQLNQTINFGTGPNQFVQIVNAGLPPEQQVVIETGFPASGEGHNYFNSQTDYELQASALFGELYYDINNSLKATLGLRYTHDEKTLNNFPLQFLQPGFGLADPVQTKADFEEVTGRLTLDWSINDDTLVYASYARGYKGGGINPSIPEGASTSLQQTFDPEFVNAIEIGSKSVFGSGRLSLNTALFHYDYEGYQVAKTAFQTVFTENIDSEIQGLELELVYQATENIRVNSQLGYLNTEITSGESIDVLNKIQDSEDVIIVRDIRGGGGLGTTCVVPTAVVEGALAAINSGQPALVPFPGASSSVNVGVLCGAPVASEGDLVDLSGKELPYSPELTLSLGAEMDIELNQNWNSTLRADYYVQGDGFARVYNALQDEIDGYDNLNLSYRVESESNGIELQFFARNLLSEDSIVTITAQADNTGGSRNVGGKQPAFYGISLTKRWN
jgi:outer membrane receptor protein involved in Fe transport